MNLTAIIQQIDFLALSGTLGFGASSNAEIMAFISTVTSGLSRLSFHDETRVEFYGLGIATCLEGKRRGLSKIGHVDDLRG